MTRKKKIFAIVIFMTFSIYQPVYSLSEQEPRDQKEKREFHFFNWKISFDKDEKKKTDEELEDDLDRYIRRSDNAVVVKERSRVKRAKERIQRDKQKKLERAKRIKDAAIDKATRRAEERTEQIKTEAQMETDRLVHGLRMIALKQMRMENDQIEPQETSPNSP